MKNQAEVVNQAKNNNQAAIKSLEIRSKTEEEATKKAIEQLNVDKEDIEDIKVAVSEACTNAIKHSLDNKFSVEYTIFENGLTITIIDSGKGYDVDSIDVPNLEEPKESGLGLFIIQSLMDEVEIKSNINYGTVIKMTKYLGVDN